MAILPVMSLKLAGGLRLIEAKGVERRALVQEARSGATETRKRGCTRRTGWRSCWSQGLKVNETPL